MEVGSKLFGSCASVATSTLDKIDFLMEVGGVEKAHGTRVSSKRVETRMEVEPWAKQLYLWKGPLGWQKPGGGKGKSLAGSVEF